MLTNFAKNIAFASALSMPVLGLLAQGALAEKDNFQIYNNSSHDVYYLYISESEVPEWQDDVLGSDILASGSSFQVYFGNPSPDVCFYDIRVELDNGEVFEDYEIDVCANDYYEIFDQ